MDYELRCETDEKETDMSLAMYLTFVKDDNFKLMVRELVESGRANAYFSDYYINDPRISVEDWVKNNPKEAASAAEDWFNSTSWSLDHDSAREFYNPTISHRDIEVTIDRSYYVNIGEDMFMVHVDDTWDEMYRNYEAIQVAKNNRTLGQMYMENYFTEDSSDEFKQKFERITGYKDKFGFDPEKLRKADPETLDDFDKIEKENLRDNIELIIDENEINWHTAWDEE